MNGLPTIEARACALLSPELVECVHQRTRVGIAKYGQRLDQNQQAERAKAVHLIQELLDGMQYALWLGREQLARRLAAEAEIILTEYSLTAAEILAGGKQ